MYKTTHRNNQRRTDHIKAAEILKPVRITVAEEYETVRVLAHKIIEEVAVMPRGPARDAKILRQVELSKRCGELKKQLGVMRHDNLSECIATQAKLICPPALWECILNAAKTEWAEIQARKNAPSEPE